MILNKNQKRATIIYCVLLVVIFLFFTPCVYYRYNGYGYEYDHDGFGDFLLIDSGRIIFTKLFFEMGLLTIICLLSLVIFKTNGK